MRADVKTNHDIAIADGPAITWRWGPFAVGPQPDALFRWPSECNQKCPLTMTRSARHKLRRFTTYHQKR